MAVRIDARRGETGAGLVLAAIGAGLAMMAWPLPVGEVGNPGAGFAPLALGLMLAMLGLVCAARGWRRAAGEVVLGERKALICIGALLAAVMLWRSAGFILAGSLLLTVLFAILARLAWWKAALAGAAVSALAAGLFGRFLGVSLPAGLLAF